MDIREKLIELLGNIYLPMMDGHNTIGEYNIPHKFKEKIADYLISHGVTAQENVKMSDELLKQLKNAPITICKSEPSIETVQEWISVKDKLPEKDGQYLIFTTQYFTPDHIDEIDHKDGIEISGYCKRYGFLSENGLHAKYWRDISQPPKGDKHMDNYELTPNTTTLKNSYDEHIIKVEITFIGDEPKSAEEIKKLLGADHVSIKSTKIFHHKRRNRRK